ncbi:nucleotidyltransferase domain-containing protein [Glaciihabitans arcticus]|uniref:Nucleotidyltransferase domain-containing protein n=1 Tax=Glaciihabitans arcticus TaxID=2668039 RepID=A0A4Q9GWY4_9MICO|nr:nucleotidyltransferase domain-containing protein [Glaciihabitans arcticus]TBN56760.1 nucleotidyltransferase domain-containing protein [Glaciihabitans arcticus]
MAEIDERALPRIETFVSALLARFPGLVESVYVTGSAATDDWHEARSDIDLVIVTWRPILERDVAALVALHAATKATTPVDALYLTVDQLADGPDSVPSAPQVVDGEFRLGVAGDQLSWVTWLELGGAPRAEIAQSGLGPWSPAPEADARTARRAAEFSAANLVSYWRPLGRNARKRALFTRGSAPVSAAAVAWVVLGPPRLVVTIEQGRIVSKAEAGLFAISEFPEYAALISRVIDWRRTGEGSFTAADAREATRLLAACVKRGSSRDAPVGL